MQVFQKLNPTKQPSYKNHEDLRHIQQNKYKMPKRHQREVSMSDNVFAVPSVAISELKLISAGLEHAYISMAGV